MKEVRREYSIVRSPDLRVISLYRFPGFTKALMQSEVRIKPASKYTEIRMSLPLKNTSALKIKMLNTDCITYRAFPATVETYYYTRIEGNKIVLYRVQSSYLFQAAHEYYPCDHQSSKLKKAESREEYEHRMRSINFKIKNVENEEFKVLSFEGCTQEQAVCEERSSSGAKTHRRMVSERPVDLKQIEETVRNARIVNFGDLLKIFPCENAVKTVLFKMTDGVCGRFVLKSSYYEAVLHEARSQMLDTFRKCGSVPTRDLGFLGEEEWMAREIADVVDGKYILRGSAEELDFDTAHIKAAILGLVKDLLAHSRVLSSIQISQELSIDKDVVCELVQNDAFFHLSNDSYALNDRTYWLNSMFDILCGKKSFELPELESRLLREGIRYQHHDLVEEVRKHCLCRGNKYFLKTSKE